MEELKVIDFSAVDEIVDKVSEGGYSFSEYVNMFAQGENSLNYRGITDSVIDIARNEVLDVKKILTEMLFVVVAAAIFVNLSKIFKSRQVSESGFYITYMLMFVLMASCFGGLYNTSKETLDMLLSYMQALVPTFFLTVSYVCGETVSVSFYQESLMLITLVEAMLVNVFLPLINIYFVFALVNPLFEESLFSNLLELLEKTVSWGIRSMLALVVGLGMVQSMIIPVAGNIRNGMLVKRAEAIPGVGDGVSSALQTVLGAGAIIKNSVGVAGLIVVVIICVAPLIRLLVYSVSFQLGAAVSQPLAGDKRMSACMLAAAKSSRLMIMAVGMSATMFMVSIAIITIATGKGY